MENHLSYAFDAQRMRWFFLTLMFYSCMDFRISDEEASEQIQNEHLKFDELHHEEHTIHFAHISKNRDTLVAFIHGSPGSWNAFIDFFKNDALLDQVDIIALDRPGFGNSDYGQAESSLQEQAELMHMALSRFSHRHKILVGHSLGGPVVARMGMDYPDAYAHLVLVAPSIDPKFEFDGKLRTWLRTPIPSFLMSNDFYASNEEIIPIRSELEQMIPLWYNIKAKVTVLHGTDDSLVPLDNVDFARIVLPDTLLEVRILEGVDHFIPWTHPEEIVKIIIPLK